MTAIRHYLISAPCMCVSSVQSRLIEYSGRGGAASDCMISARACPPLPHTFGVHPSRLESLSQNHQFGSQLPIGIRPRQVVEEKLSELIKRKGVVCHHDNAHANPYTSSATQQILGEFGTHPP
ncbi:hypothetical protein EVAR_58093_1 [Eumeta japonica]|uniref:Histone-lysine N-methyltransferase SETMAR n=1 Tax=Eumeta variegata TaxID=151549 RepID=A0A4C1YQ89_EUMVA|nr:hypothetical protein EVAR_58093_1 [Eumeta japonica]